MTDTPETATDAATANIIRLMNEHTEAQANADLFDRLKAAPALAAKLATELATAVAAQAKLLDAAALAAHNARFDGLGDISVRDMTPEQSVLGSSFEITYMQHVYNMYTNGSEPVSHTINGFQQLPRRVTEYLIEQHPLRIPAKIARLAATPGAAFDRYFSGLRRGYLLGTADDV